MAALMEEHGISAVAEVPKSSTPVFIPSACWRNIAPGVLSTTRFVGMLLAEQERLAVYDIGDGSMEWQVRAEGSLFYTKYGSYETKATGMILICEDGKGNKAAKNIIRQTMWSRRRLLSDICLERNKPTCWSRSPIKLLESDMPAPPQVRYAICYRKLDRPILRMYPDIFELEGLQFYEYQSEENDSTD